MDSSEIKGLVWETLACAPSSLPPEDIAKETGLGLQEVLRSIAALRALRLVEVVQPLPRPTYIAALQLDALRWAVALEEGVPLTVLEKHASLAIAGRQEALRMATDGSVERARASDREEKKKQREAILHGRAATKAAATDVARIADDTKNMMERVSKERPDIPQEVMSILRRAHEQAAKAVEQIARSLG